MSREDRTDLLSASLEKRFAAMLDRSSRSGSAPQGIHWCLCTPDASTEQLGQDGHPVSDGTFLPVGSPPRRMWAASNVTFGAPINIGAAVSRRSTVASVTEKTGSSGPLQFVDVDHVTIADGAIAVEERQTIVFRAPPIGPTIAPKRTPEGQWHYERIVVPSSALLFRYSALTFNTHRIHYDLPYAQQVEGYPGLVVQGPLLATLLLDLIDREHGPDAVSTFSFRAVAPAFVDAPIRLLARASGDRLELCARSIAGDDHMLASATLQPQLKSDRRRKSARHRQSSASSGASL